MFKMNRLADYASMIMHFLAENQGKYYSAAALSQKIPIALPTISKILKLLHETGLLQSIRGSKGGYQLSSAPKEISLFSIICAIEGKTAALTQCGLNALCEHEISCKLKNHWRVIGKAMTDILENLSLADLLGNHQQLKIKMNQLKENSLCL